MSDNWEGLREGGVYTKWVGEVMLPLFLAEPGCSFYTAEAPASAGSFSFLD